MKTKILSLIISIASFCAIAQPHYPIPLMLTEGADVASASTLTLGFDGNSFNVTGTTTIDSIATLVSNPGQRVLLKFAGAVSLTHSADIDLPGNTNLTTAANDILEFEEYATGQWVLVGYTLESGEALVGGVTITNDANNRTLTSNGDGTINAESNMTNDGTTVTVTAPSGSSNGLAISKNGSGDALEVTQSGAGLAGDFNGNVDISGSLTSSGDITINGDSQFEITKDFSSLRNMINFNNSSDGLADWTIRANSTSIDIRDVANNINVIRYVNSTGATSFEGSGTYSFSGPISTITGDGGEVLINAGAANRDTNLKILENTGSSGVNFHLDGDGNALRFQSYIAGSLNQDNVLTMDYVNHRIGIMTGTPSSTLDVNGSLTAGDITSTSLAGGGTRIVTANSSGTLEAESGNTFESGTFTPEVADAITGGNTATGTFTARYQVVGDMVTVWINLVSINTSGMTSGNNLYIRNLPFSPSSDGLFYIGTVTSQNLALPDEQLSSNLRLSSGNEELRIAILNSVGGFNHLTVGDLTSGSSSLYLSVSYIK